MKSTTVNKLIEELEYMKEKGYGHHEVLHFTYDRSPEYLPLEGKVRPVTKFDEEIYNNNIDKEKHIIID